VLGNFLQRLIIFGGTLAVGCAVVNDIGESVDRGATKVVKAGSNLFDGSTKAPPPPTEGEESALTASRKAYDEGKIAFDVAKYEVALEKFEESFALADGIEDADLRAQVQATLFFNLAQAHLKSYELDDDATHLTRARDLLRNHLNADATLGDHERANVEQLIADVEATIARVDTAAPG
jgi:tetratricopeptide (TPR) repeat protein